MIAISATATAVVARSHRRFLAVESWLAGVLLAADVPVDAASEETDATSAVPERVSFTVPRFHNGRNWSPVGDTHPLAANGQRLVVKMGVDLGNGEVEWFQRGVFLIHDSEADGDVVTVNAVGLLELVREARLVSPFQPGGTLASTLRGLVEPALTVDVTVAPPDRSVPAAINFDEDRLGAALEVLDAWAADGRIDATGVLKVVVANVVPDAVLALTDGAGGTVITATGSSTRDGAYNAVVARGTASDGGQVQAISYDSTTGPKRYNGPFNPLPVPYFFQSPLLTTIGQCAAAADTVLARLQRRAGRAFTVRMVPNPALQTGDRVTVTTADYTGLLCAIEALTLPYLPGGGEQTLRVVAV